MTIALFRSCRGPSAALFSVREDYERTIRERLSERLLKLLEHLGLGFEELVIISLRQDQ